MLNFLNLPPPTITVGRVQLRYGGESNSLSRAEMVRYQEQVNIYGNMGPENERLLLWTFTESLLLSQIVYGSVFGWLEIFYDPRWNLHPKKSLTPDYLFAMLTMRF